jgi:hypothetical protein
MKARMPGPALRPGDIALAQITRPQQSKVLRQFVAELVRDLAGGSFLQHQRNVVLIGGSWRGCEPLAGRLVSPGNRRALGSFFAFLEDGGRERVQDIGPLDVRDYLEAAKVNGLSTATLKQHMAAVRMLLFSTWSPGGQRVPDAPPRRGNAAK